MGRNPRSNLGELIKDELVRRFESVVSEEIRKHNLIIEKQEKRMESFDCELHELVLKIQETCSNNKNYYLKTDKHFTETVKEMEHTYESLSSYIRNAVENIDTLANILDLQMKSLVDKKEYEKGNVEIDEKIQHMDHKLESCVENLKKFQHEEKCQLEKQLDKLSEIQADQTNSNNKQFHDQDKKIDEYIVDAKGVLRELQIYKKENFILKKKIEHIYSLLGRSPEGGKVI